MSYGVCVPESIQVFLSRNFPSFSLLTLFFLLDGIKGLSINNFNLHGGSYPLIWGGDAVNYTVGSNTEISSNCYPGAMNSDKVRGTIVLCDSLYDGSGILLAGGVGTVMADSEYNDFAFSYPLPATKISPEDGLKILNYITTTE